jgi:glycosyltransferase involved in cell wall biosynthesis
MNLDIIIPTYNAKNTLDKTLSSIAIQKGIKDINVYIINDASDYNYDEYINYYSKFFSIQEITLEKNQGPGVARRIGLEKSNNHYITFIDSDDYFFSPLSLETLYNNIVETNSDLVITDFLYERDNEKVIKSYNTVWLHGKIYKREFLEKNKITFNDTRANEDNGFNRLILLSEPNIYYLPRTTYVYYENENSITRKNNRAYRLDGLEGYTYNLNWAMEQALKRNLDRKKIALTALEVLVYMYHYYMELNNIKVINWSKEIYKKYLELKEYITEEEYQKYITNIDPQTPKIIYLTFEEFIKKVGK